MGDRPRGGNSGRTFALGALGLVAGPVGWASTLYATAFAVSGARDVAPTVFVLVELAVIAGLVIGAIRARPARTFFVGAAASFATVTLLYWTS